MTSFAHIVLFCLSTTWSLAAPASQRTSPRVFSASSSEPFATQFNLDPRGKAALTSVVNMFAMESNKHNNRLANWVYGISFDEYPCNCESSERFIMGLNNTLASRGFGDLYRPCITDVKLELNATMEGALFEYIHAIDRSKFAVLKSVENVMLRAGRVWKEAHTFSIFNYLQDVQDCKLYHISAFYVRGRWAVTADITNAQPGIFRKDYERWYLSENLFLDAKNHVRALRIRAQGYQMRKTVRNSTTTFANWAGNPGTTRFAYPLTPAQNPAIQAAILKRVHERKRVKGLLSKSNIAVSVLPLVLALIPVASFADVGKISTFGYLLISDVAAMIPFAVKGVELILFSQLSQDATILRIYGATKRDTVGAAELWHTKCEINGPFLLIGELFLSIAVCFMVVGIVLEFVVRGRIQWRKMESVKEKGKEKGKEKDVADEQLWEKYGLAYAKCDGTCAESATVLARPRELAKRGTIPIASGGIV